jgi:hypothetical protein
MWGSDLPKEAIRWFAEQVEVAMRFTVKVEWQEENGSVATAELGKIESAALQSAADVGLKLSDTKPILVQLQDVVIGIQMRDYCGSVRDCPSCRRPRTIKDYRQRRLHTVFGNVPVNTPRFDRCGTCERGGVYSPLAELLPQRVLPELCHLQAELSAEMPYSRAAAVSFP